MSIRTKDAQKRLIALILIGSLLDPTVVLATQNQTSLLPPGYNEAVVTDDLTDVADSETLTDESDELFTGEPSTVDNENVSNPETETDADTEAETVTEIDTDTFDPDTDGIEAILTQSISISFPEDADHQPLVITGGTTFDLFDQVEATVQTVVQTATGEDTRTDTLSVILLDDDGFTTDNILVRTYFRLVYQAVDPVTGFSETRVRPLVVVSPSLNETDVVVQFGELAVVYVTADTHWDQLQRDLLADVSVVQRSADTTDNATTQVLTQAQVALADDDGLSQWLAIVQGNTPLTAEATQAFLATMAEEGDLVTFTLTYEVQVSSPVDNVGQTQVIETQATRAVTLSTAQLQPLTEVTVTTHQALHDAVQSAPQGIERTIVIAADITLTNEIVIPSQRHIRLITDGEPRTLLAGPGIGNDQFHFRGGHPAGQNTANAASQVHFTIDDPYLTLRGRRTNDDVSVAQAALSGGGLHFNNGAVVQLRAGTISHVQQTQSTQRGPITIGHHSLTTPVSYMEIHEGFVVANNRGLHGAIHLPHGGRAHIHGGIFRGNGAFGNASSDGGVITTRLTSSLTITGGLFYNNRAQRSGGVILAHGNGSGPLIITGGIFRNNLAAGEHGGVIFLHNSNTNGTRQVTIGGDAVFENNRAHLNGGVLQNSQAHISVTIADTVVMKNNTAGQSGGAISLTGTAPVNITGAVQLTGNQATNGGAIAIGGNGSNQITISGTRIADNVATALGGGIVHNANNVNATRGLTLMDTTFENNRANQGGAIARVPQAQMNSRGLDIQQNNRFINNYATVEGGAIHLGTTGSFISRTSNFTIEAANVFNGNTVTTAGEALTNHTLAEGSEALQGLHNRIHWQGSNSAGTTRDDTAGWSLFNRRDVSIVDFPMIVVREQTDAAATVTLVNFPAGTVTGTAHAPDSWVRIETGHAIAFNEVSVQVPDTWIVTHEHEDGQLVVTVTVPPAPPAPEPESETESETDLESESETDPESESESESESETPSGTAPAPEPEMPSSPEGENGSGSETTPDGGNNQGNETTPGGGNSQGNETTPGGGNSQGNETIPGGGNNQGNETTPGGDNNQGNETTPGGGSNQGNETTPGGDNSPGNETTPSDGDDTDGLIIMGGTGNDLGATIQTENNDLIVTENTGNVSNLLSQDSPADVIDLVTESLEVDNATPTEPIATPAIALSDGSGVLSGMDHATGEEMLQITLGDSHIRFIIDADGSLGVDPSTLPAYLLAIPSEEGISLFSQRSEDIHLAMQHDTEHGIFDDNGIMIAAYLGTTSLTATGELVFVENPDLGQPLLQGTHHVTWLLLAVAGAVIAMFSRLRMIAAKNKRKHS